MSLKICIECEASKKRSEYPNCNIDGKRNVCNVCIKLYPEKDQNTIFKRCSDCCKDRDKWVPFTAFSRAKKNNDGVATKCKECAKKPKEDKLEITSEDFKVCKGECGESKNVMEDYGCYYRESKTFYYGTCKVCTKESDKDTASKRHVGVPCKECGKHNLREVGKPTCYICNNKRGREAIIEERKTITHKECTKCHETVAISEMLTDANQCRVCKKISRDATKEDNKEKLKTMDLTVLRECTKCVNVKELREFVLRTDSYIYRYRCIDCDKDITKNKFIRFRLAKILEDPEKFRRMAAEQMCKWRYDNHEKWKEMNKKYKNCISSKLKYIKNYIGKHGRRCELTDSEIEKIITSNCYYCDIEPNTFGEDDYCGLDRVDNTGNYTLGNVVPACTRCNNIKGCLSQDVLFKHIENIVCGTDNEIDFEYNAKTFLTYKHSANKRKKVFELSKSEFDTIIKNECYICRNKSNNGIDRVVNSTGYITSNCQSACSSCNYMKKDLDLNVFLKHLETMYNTMKPYTFEELNHTQIQQKYILDKEKCAKFKIESANRAVRRKQTTDDKRVLKTELLTLGDLFETI
jgi:hypothetical protein